MTKQEEIREGMEKVICSQCDDVAFFVDGQTLADEQESCRKEGVCAYCTDLREAIQKYEASKGVVIKVNEMTYYVEYEPLIGDKDA